LPQADLLARGATPLLYSPYPAYETWDQLPERLQRQIVEKGLRVYAIDAYQVAQDTGMGRRINTIMQVCFFHLAGAATSASGRSLRPSRRFSCAT
jgi:pyruvate-ferredoxin/flavodoxin oxidoreductase